MPDTKLVHQITNTDTKRKVNQTSPLPSPEARLRELEGHQPCLERSRSFVQFMLSQLPNHVLRLQTDKMGGSVPQQTYELPWPYSKSHILNEARLNVTTPSCSESMPFFTRRYTRRHVASKIIGMSTSHAHFLRPYSFCMKILSLRMRFPKKSSCHNMQY